MISSQLVWIFKNGAQGLSGKKEKLIDGRVSFLVFLRIWK
jgi:hypothetical protein